jgi:hypothetical protein
MFPPNAAGGKPGLIYTTVSCNKITGAFNSGRIP